MSALTEHETAKLNLLAIVYLREPLLTAAGRIIADGLRRSLPDLDDATIARVALVLSDIAAGMTTPTNLFGSQVTCAALELTAIERADAPR